MYGSTLPNGLCWPPGTGPTLVGDGGAPSATEAEDGLFLQPPKVSTVRNSTEPTVIENFAGIQVRMDSVPRSFNWRRGQQWNSIGFQ